MFRKSLGTIPFRRTTIDKANTTQLLTRRNSMAKPVRKEKLTNQEELLLGRPGEKAVGEKSSFFDSYLSDNEMLKDYKMMSHIGKGCFSTVSLAIHRETNKAYAIKTY